MLAVVVAVPYSLRYHAWGTMSREANLTAAESLPWMNHAVLRSQI